MENRVAHHFEYLNFFAEKTKPCTRIIGYDWAYLMSALNMNAPRRRVSSLTSRKVQIYLSARNSPARIMDRLLGHFLLRSGLRFAQRSRYTRHEQGKCVMLRVAVPAFFQRHPT